MRSVSLSFVICLPLIFAASLHAACPLDHFEIGVNPDGLPGTADDLQLYVDCTQIYRHSDPADNGSPTWRYWHYPLYYSVIYHNYYIGEPGFDTIKADDPNHCLTGAPLTDYNIFVECVSISPGLTASYTGSPSFTLSTAGDSFAHSTYSDTHMHMTYRAPTSSSMYWITYRLYDSIGTYQPSDEFTLVFAQDPLDGDISVDGVVDYCDLARFCDYWLFSGASRSNDFCQRADVNKDGSTDLFDFGWMASNWCKQGAK